jgi:hypothetical protein
VIAATLQANEELPSGSSFGGLRGGYAKLTKSAAILRSFSLVPGVALTATFPVRSHLLETANIKVSGSQAAPGVVRFGDSTVKATGTLGGKRFAIAIARVKLSRLGAGGWPSLARVADVLTRRRASAFAGALPSSWLP